MNLMNNVTHVDRVKYRQIPSTLLMRRQGVLPMLSSLHMLAARLLNLLCKLRRNWPHPHNTPHNALKALTLAITLGTLLGAVSGCGSPDSKKDNNILLPQAMAAASEATVTEVATQTAVATSTGTSIVGTHTPGATATPGTPGTPGTATATPNYRTSIPATKEAFATHVAINRQALKTSVALTHAPTITPGEPEVEPSATPLLGMLPGCSNTDAYGPQAISCWRGVVSGQLVDVSAGREGRSGDMSQGIVRVHTHGQQGDDIYQTPNRVGAVRIVSVSGTLFTLTTVSQPTPQAFIFNLATRQWVSP